MSSVSVIIPVYNAEATIARSVKSILNQSLNDIELIVVDDGSTDNTSQVLAEFSDSRMRIVSTPHSGVAHAANVGTQQSTAPLIARMDADDFSSRRRLELQVALLQKTKADVVGCQVRIITEQGNDATNLNRYKRWINEETLHSDDIRALRFVEFPIVNPTILARREYFEAGFNDNEFPEDYDLMLRAARRGISFAKVPEVLFDWYDSANRLTRRSRNYSDDAFMACRRHHLLIGPLADVSEVDLWGMGKTGKPWLRCLLEHNIGVRRAYDVSPKKIGHRIHGTLVSDGELIPQSDGVPLVIAVGADGARPLIRELIESRGHVTGETAWFVA